MRQGRDIPCPIALARPAKPCAVVEDYGIRSSQTALLSDRRGNLVGIVDEGDDGVVALVQKCLADKPAPQAEAPAR